MHVILVSDRSATARTITLGGRHLAIGAMGLVLLVLSISSLFSFITLRHAEALRLPFVQEMLLSLREEESRKTQDFLREHLNTMAAKLGQLQAQMMRLDSLGERLGGAVGIKPQELKLSEPPGRGGLLVEPAYPLSANELQHQLDELARDLDTKGDYLGLLESEIRDERIRLKQMPTTLPLSSKTVPSGFGWRIDPFTGLRALHEGVDFTADNGAPIRAAAGGVVVAAEHHPQYGNMVEVDHGAGLTTRYAHASKITVKLGAMVQRGQKIAEVGSTGRSTGSHLHFEVRRGGIALNPARFLQHAHSSDLLAVHSK